MWGRLMIRRTTLSTSAQVVGSQERLASLTSLASDAEFAARITRSASKQAYYIARVLADRDRRNDAYRAYGYFRWVDDTLDQQESDQEQLLAFVRRQQALVERCYQGDWPSDLSAEERLLADLISRDDERESGLQSYIRNMMAVMAFDANRRGRAISECELADYTRNLAIAVTDALHYFIGHVRPPADDETRYLAAMGAHITHMLRDTLEDTAMGYYNVPGEFLTAHNIGPHDIFSAPYREWVKDRTRLARACFSTGSRYLHQVESLRCRVAGFAYMARFTGILTAIKRDDYYLRPSYADVNGVGYVLRNAGSVGAHALFRGAL